MCFLNFALKLIAIARQALPTLYGSTAHITFLCQPMLMMVDALKYQQ